MEIYTFWNNKGGTGKTSLCFQTIIRYASTHQRERILVIDMCPQANLSELLQGGMVGNGAINLDALYNRPIRCSVGGYFQFRFSSPTHLPQPFVASDFISKPSTVNANIPNNVSLVAGDNMVELQSSYISNLATTQIPGNNYYVAVLSWLKDFLTSIQNDFDVVFIDTNPSFSIYTQIALAATQKLIIPVMADDSSKRALNNVLALLYGIQLPPIYANNAFNSTLTNANMPLPQIHMIIKNRLTQYMGPASGYQSVLRSIDILIQQLQQSHPASFSRPLGIIQEVRDFQSTGVVAFAEAKSFDQLLNEKKTHFIDRQKIQLKTSYIQNNASDIQNIVNNL